MIMHTRTRVHRRLGDVAFHKLLQTHTQTYTHTHTNTYRHTHTDTHTEHRLVVAYISTFARVQLPSCCEETSRLQ